MTGLGPSHAPHPPSRARSRPQETIHDFLLKVEENLSDMLALQAVQHTVGQHDVALAAQGATQIAQGATQTAQAGELDGLRDALEQQQEQIGALFDAARYAVTAVAGLPSVPAHHEPASAGSSSELAQPPTPAGVAAAESASPAWASTSQAQARVQLAPSPAPALPPHLTGSSSEPQPGSPFAQRSGGVANSSSSPWPLGASAPRAAPLDASDSPGSVRRRGKQVARPSGATGGAAGGAAAGATVGAAGGAVRPVAPPAVAPPDTAPASFGLPTANGARSY